MTTKLGQQVTVSKLIAIQVVVQNSRLRSVVFLWWVLWLNDTSYSKSVKRDK